MPKPIIVNLAADGQTAEVLIRGYVGGWNTNLEEVDAQINGMNVTTILVRINTLGGLAHEGIAIHNVLRAHPARVEVMVEGVAGSAGSIIAMAGDEIAMYANALMMIHGCQALDDWGDPVDTPETRAMVQAWNEALVETYTARTGQTADEIRALLTTDTWMTAREAVAAGFADRVEELTPAAQAASPFAVIASATAIPAEVLTRAQAEAAPEADPGNDPAADHEDPPSPGDDPAAETFAAQVAAIADAQGFADQAATWLLDGSLATVDQARAAIAEAREVRDFCAHAGAADQAAGFIAARKTMADVRTSLVNAKAAASDAHVTDNHPNQGHPAPAQQVTALGDVYARNRAAARAAHPRLFH